jgi:hypothetical protein
LKQWGSTVNITVTTYNAQIYTKLKLDNNRPAIGIDDDILANVNGIHEINISNNIGELIWGTVRRLFAYSPTREITIDLALIQPYKIYEHVYPYCRLTGCPKIATTNSFKVIPITDIKQRVHIIEDFRQYYENQYWVNWWLTFGPWGYPEDHRYELQQQWRWREL